MCRETYRIFFPTSECIVLLPRMLFLFENFEVLFELPSERNLLKLCLREKLCFREVSSYPYTMSQRLSRLLAEKIINVGEKKYKYIDSFEAQDIFYGYNIHDYDPASLTFFFSFFSEDEKKKLISESMQQAEARQKIQKETKERDERDIELNKKNAVSIKNMIKIN